MRSFDELLHDMKLMRQYLDIKAKEKDWHGVADCAMDLREMEVELKCMEEKEKDVEETT